MNRRSCFLTAAMSRFLNARKDGSLGPSSTGYSFLASALPPTSTIPARMTHAAHAPRLLLLFHTDSDLLTTRDYRCERGHDGPRALCILVTDPHKPSPTQ